VRGRGLTVAPPQTADLPEAFDRWLTGPVGAPVAVALSGGGDSLALLHLAEAWADRAGRTLVALTVDHGLQPASAAWSAFAAERAQRLGVATRTLRWLGDKPQRGLPAAARAARHALLADAARAAGARVILMGHTADDVLEAEAMRAAGASAPSPRTWSPSPAWPAGRRVFLLRPLLRHRRADLRALLAGLGETWIDDPANDDPHYARTLARRRLARTDAAAPAIVDARPAWAGLAAVRQGVAGELTLPRVVLAAADPSVLGALALCAAGTSRPPPAAALRRIAERLSRGDAFVASLGGARIAADHAEVLICREAGERARRGLQPVPSPIGQSVFDGRFELDLDADGCSVGFLAGLAPRLSPAQRSALKRIPAAARGALPAVISPSGKVSCPVLDQSGAPSARPLCEARLRATLGGVSDEAALWRVAESAAVP
jgi:tRNA(Ile)-lysidine synthase